MNKEQNDLVNKTPETRLKMSSLNDDLMAKYLLGWIEEINRSHTVKQIKSKHTRKKANRGKK